MRVDDPRSDAPHKINIISKWYRVEFYLGIPEDVEPPAEWREFWAWITDESTVAVIDDPVVRRYEI